MTIAVPHIAADFQIAVEMAADAIARSLSRYDRASHADVFRLEVPIAAGSLVPLEWLAAQTTGPITYWSDRESRFEMAGVGAAHIIQNHDRINFPELLSSLRRYLRPGTPGIRYYGGICFDPSSPGGSRTKSAGEWRNFGSCYFVLPRFEVVATGQATTFACNLFTAGGRESIDTILGQLALLRSAPSESGYSIARLLSREDLPDREGWDKMVTAALEAIERQQLEKVVLARRTSLKFSNELDPAAILKKLVSISDSCFHFCFQAPSSSGGSSAFIGASPERLYFRDGLALQSEAQAGTRPRSDSPEADLKFEKELLDSGKDRREQEYVARFIGDCLGGFCRSVKMSGEPRVVKLPGVQHLVTRFEGELRPGVGDADILAALHPTPAVGGYPAGAAFELISRLEPLERGWYAGPVGWVGPDAAEFAVAIRSALVAADRLYLYAGAGIVGGSEPGAEWDEIESKISNFLKAVSAP